MALPRTVKMPALILLILLALRPTIINVSWASLEVGSIDPLTPLQSQLTRPVRRPAQTGPDRALSVWSLVLSFSVFGLRCGPVSGSAFLLRSRLRALEFFSFSSPSPSPVSSPSLNLRISRLSASDLGSRSLFFFFFFFFFWACRSLPLWTLCDWRLRSVNCSPLHPPAAGSFQCGVSFGGVMNELPEAGFGIGLVRSGSSSDRSGLVQDRLQTGPVLGPSRSGPVQSRPGPMNTPNCKERSESGSYLKSGTRSKLYSFNTANS
ncbi:hypothetical protein Cgig2_015377 [Carnegiea gigantea]|uniref:Secreted protein n=1 Tax=Carnegiea gigantea TaxID=171969 RepID=A0A9Q1QEY2_9CARY|nr:hypothetical protein Cgig2_015377 [Carnegiea gigantea]